MEKEIRQPAPASSSSADLDDAVVRIYEQYGANLSAFFRDAYDEIALKCEDPRNGFHEKRNR